MSLLLYGTPATPVEAYVAATSTWSSPASSSTYIDFPSGLRATVTAGGSHTILSSTSTLGNRGWSSSYYNPTNMVTGDSAATPGVNTHTCASAGACPNLGTLTISFNQPVRSPTIHLAGIGGYTRSGQNQSDIHAVLDLTTAGLTLTSLAGNGQLAVTNGGTRITATDDSAANGCTTNSNGSGLAARAAAACGSVRVNGTVTSVAFAMSAVLVRNPSAQGPYNSSGTGDDFNLAITVPQDFGDAPATYDGAQAATHVLSDLTLGSGVTEDNPNTRNATTSPNAGSGANGDTDDAFTSLPTIHPGEANSYALTVPVSGLSKTAYLCGYIDIDRNGVFATTTAERQCATLSGGATSATLTWSIAASTTPGNTYARFRLGYTQAQVHTPTGVAHSGEVEDYPVVMARPSVTLFKTTLGAAGGPFAFTLTNTTQLSGTVTTTAADTATQVDGNTATTGLQPFTVVALNTAVTIEEAASGWALASAACTDSSGATVGSLNGTRYTIPASANVRGAAITCDFTNGRPRLRLVKSVDNSYAGSAGLNANQWTVRATLSGATTPAVSGTGSTTETVVSPGVYTLAETSANSRAPGYTAGNWVCGPTVSGDTITSSVTGSTLTMRNLDRVTCTITNTARPASLTWTKADGSGSALGGSTWMLTGPSHASGSIVTDCVAASAGACTGHDKDPAAGAFRVNELVWGTYTLVEESAPEGYVASTDTRTVSVDGATANLTASFGSITNRRITGTVTWTKVDAGADTSLLSGSEWTLTGPGHPDPGTTVADCVEASPSACTGPDTNPAAGTFTLTNVEFGSYTLVEKTAPVGFQLDPTPQTFSIATDGQTVTVGAISNELSPVPALPLTGGTSTDAFILVGLALLAAAGVVGGLHRRRLLKSPSS